MPSEVLFYGYCNQAKYFCTWDINTNRIGYIDEAAYNINLSDMNTISASGLDDMTLTLEPSATSEDPTIARELWTLVKVLS